MFYKALKEHKSVIEFLRFKQNYKDEIFNYTYNYINNFKGYYENKIFTNIQLYTNRQIKALNKIQRNFNDYKVFNYNNFNFKNFAPSFYEKFIFTTYGQNFYNRILFENFIKRYYPQFLFLHFKTKGVNEFNNPYFTNVSYKNIKFFNSNTLSNFLTYKSKKKVEKNFTSYQNLYNYNFQQAFSNKDFQQNTIIKYEEIQKEIMLLKSNFSTSKGKNTNVDFESLYEKIKERIFEEVFFMSGGFY